MDITRKMELIRKTSVLSFSDYLNEDNGFQIRMEDFDAELASAYKDSTGQDMTSTIANSNVKVKNSGDANSGGSMGKNDLNEFTLKARKSGIKTLVGLETDDLVDKNGNLKSRYTPGFIKAWESALDAYKAGTKFGYFFYSGGLYEIDNVKASLTTPCNWSKWLSVNPQNDFDNINLFAANYQSLYVTSFAKLPSVNKIKCVELLNANDSISGKSYENTMNRLQQYVNKFKNTGLISLNDLKGINKDLNVMFGDDDWGYDEFAVFNNIMVILANTFTINDDAKMVSSVRWLFENSNLIVEARRLADDRAFDNGVTQSSPAALIIKPNGDVFNVVAMKSGEAKTQTGVKLDSKTNDTFSKITALTQCKKPGIHSILAQNLYYIVNGIYDSLAGHMSRMNAKEFSKVPQPSGNKTFDSGK